MVGSSPSNLRKFGQEVRRLRERAGLTQGQLAAAIPIAQSMISAIEGGRKATKIAHITRMDKVLNTGGALLDYWQTLDSHNGFAEYLRDVVPLHQRATEIREYSPLLIPGLLQTERYAWAILRAGNSVPSDAHVEEQVRARIERQALLRREEAPLLIVVVDEAALCRPIGGRETMRQQLSHLLEMSSGSRVVAQVIPMATEYPPALDGGFQLIKIPDENAILYLETRVTGSHIHDPDAVELYTRLFENLRGVALPEGASRDLITRIKREFE